MYRLLESIRVENGKMCYREAHERRMNDSRKALFGLKEPLCLSDTLLPQQLPYGTYKCRIIYSDNIHTVEVQPYVIRSVRSLQLVECNDIDYSHKYENRGLFEQLSTTKKADEIIIVKHGLLTDTTYSNIVFYDGKKWITPSSFLLNGTQRQRLLQTGRIVSAEIRPTDMKHFRYAKLINAMLDLENSPTIVL